MPNPLQYKLYFWIIMCGIIYGFDKTQPLLLCDGFAFQGYFVIIVDIFLTE